MSKLRNRLIGVVFLVSAIFLMYQVFREAIAEVIVQTPSTPEQHQTALQIAPKDPAVQSWVGAYYMLDTVGRDSQKAIDHYKTAVLLNPSNYFYWGELGSAYEMSGDLDLSEQCYRNMVSLSPSFDRSHWLLANCLLRKGELDESLSEFRAYLDINPYASPYIFGLLSKAQGVTLTEIGEKVVPTSGPAERCLPPMQSAAGTSRWESDPWQSLSKNEQQELKPYGDAMISTLIYIKSFDAARSIWNTYLDDQSDASQLMVNGSFEKPDKYPPGFGWKGDGPLTGNLTLTSATGHSSKVALHIDLTGQQSKAPVSILQLVGPLGPGRYTMTFFAKGAGFVPPIKPIVVVLDADHHPIPSASDQPPPGTYEWAERQITFTTQGNNQGVYVAIEVPALAVYGETANGELFLDDFSIQKVG